MPGATALLGRGACGAGAPDARRRGADLRRDHRLADATPTTSRAAPEGDGGRGRSAGAAARQSLPSRSTISTRTLPHAGNDVAETMAIKRAFGEYANSAPIALQVDDRLTSAAGAIEAAATIMALTQPHPPTINRTPDPACDLDYVPNQARPAALQIAMSNSFGFGGINGVLVFAKPTAV